MQSPQSEAKTSQWPVPPGSVRYIIPPWAIDRLIAHPLSRDLYPRAFGHYRVAHGHQMHRREHDDNLLIYCTDGAASLEVEGQQLDLTAGDLVLLPAGVAHRYASDPERPWSLHWVHYTGALAEEFRWHMGFEDGIFRRKIGHQPRLLVDFNGLLSVRQKGFRHNALLHASNRLRQLLSAVALWDESGSAGEGMDVETVHAYMQDHIAERLTLEQLAELVDLSPSHFATRYRKLTGVSPIQHFLHLKVERACQLLDSTPLSFGAISNQLGYEDSYYFSRLFKKLMGQSPRHYRYKNQH